MFFYEETRTFRSTLPYPLPLRPGISKMAAKTCDECLSFLSTFLDKKDFNCLLKTCKGCPDSTEFLKQLLGIICDSFPTNYEARHEEDISEVSSGVHFLSLASQIPALFNSSTVLGAFETYFQELVDSEKHIECWKLYKVFMEIVQNCRLPWLLQVREQDVENLEVLHLERPKENIMLFLLSLLKHIDLIPLQSQQLKGHLKIKLFPWVLEICHSVLQKLADDQEGLSEKTLRNMKLSVLKKISCDSVLICLQQMGQCYWSSNQSRKSALKFLEFITDGCGCKDLGELLSGSESESSARVEEIGQRKIFPNGLLGNILQSMKFYVTKDKLPELPVATHVLVWSVRKVQHPFLGKNVSMVLPPLLLLLDDYRVDIRVVGIKSLQHVVENVNATELCWYGRADVIYEALHHRLYTNEPEVIRVLEPCLLKILKVIEPLPKKPASYRKMNKCDENFQIILSSMEFESKIALRRAYCSHLVEFVEHMGITVLCHFKHLMRVIFKYLEISDGTTEEWRLTMLDVLKAVIANTWPRIASYADEVLRCLMKLIIDVSMSDVFVNVKQLMFVKIEECLLMLLVCCGEPVKRQLEDMTTGLGLREAEGLISRTLKSHALKND